MKICVIWTHHLLLCILVQTELCGPLHGLLILPITLELFTALSPFLTSSSCCLLQLLPSVFTDIPRLFNTHPLLLERNAQAIQRLSAIFFLCLQLTSLFVYVGSMPSSFTGHIQPPLEITFYQSRRVQCMHC